MLLPIPATSLLQIFQAEQQHHAQSLNPTTLQLHVHELPRSRTGATFQALIGCLGFLLGSRLLSQHVWL